MATTGRTAVLVVEDDAPLRELYRRTLTVAGFAVTAVADGLTALQQIFSNRPDALVLDLALPRVSGSDVQRELASRPDTRNIPIVVVTGTDTTELHNGDVAFILKKPIDQAELIYRGRECFAGRPDVSLSARSPFRRVQDTE